MSATRPEVRAGPSSRKPSPLKVDALNCSCSSSSAAAGNATSIASSRSSRDRLTEVLLRRQFSGRHGDTVGARPAALPGDGNRAVRKEIDRKHTAQASDRAKTVKLADLIDNCKDITRHDPRFARIYLREMARLLDVLHDGDSRLLEKAGKVHRTSLEKLGLRDISEFDRSIEILTRLVHLTLGE